MNDLFSLIIFAAACALVAGGLLALATFVGPRRRQTAAKQEPFECGFPQAEPPSGEFPVKFYLFAILFVIFDVEILFLIPYAVTLRDAGLYGLGAMTIFVVFLFLGLAYAWRKGGLEWQ